MLRFVQLLLGQALPLHAVDLEHFQSFGEQADLVGTAQSWNRGIEFLIGDLTHGVHDRRERTQNAVAHTK